MRIPAITLVLIPVLLSGCQPGSGGALLRIPLITKAQTSTVQPDVIGTALDGDLERWLSEVSRLMTLTEEQVQAELQQSVTTKADPPEQLFRYALLNQQLKDWLGWIRARDSLEKLAANPELSASLLALVRLLQFHNQSMINAEARQSRLLSAIQEQDRIQQQHMAELQLRQDQVLELSNKIEALTNLEKSMSIRRALTTDTPKTTPKTSSKTTATPNEPVND